MLVMSRREGETILIGDDIELVVVHVGRTRVKLGIRAPREVPITALEWKLVREENLQAAAGSSREEVSSLVRRLQPHTEAATRNY